jgi:hypothetical protein
MGTPTTPVTCIYISGAKGTRTPALTQATRCFIAGLFHLVPLQCRSLPAGLFSVRDRVKSEIKAGERWAPKRRIGTRIPKSGTRLVLAVCRAELVSSAEPG